MKRIMHILLQWGLSLTARMPFGILYVLSDIIYIMVFHVARYRRKVVEKNLAVSFPDMDEDVLRKVEKQFYRNFADYIVETIKLMHISDRQMASRMTFDGIEHINNTVGKGRSVVCFFSHCGNWEWVTSITQIGRAHV